MIPQLLPIPERLRQYITSFWYINQQSAPGQDNSFITMADGCPGLIFQDPAAGIMRVGDRKLAPLYIYGQASTWSELSVEGRFDAIGICFQPAAFRRFFKIPADIITDSCLSVAEIGTQDHRDITNLLIDARNLGERSNILMAYLASILSANKLNPDSVTDNAVSMIVSTAGNISLPELQKRLHISERSLERRFRENVGISARLFARICRFQDAIRQVKRQDYSRLSDIAYENGYADQSHFIRSFRSFAGCSPNQYKNKSVQLLDSFPGDKDFDERDFDEQHFDEQHFDES